MRCLILILFYINFASIAARAEGQACPIVFSDLDGSGDAQRICSVIQDFNQNDVPGIMTDDCEGDECCDDDDPSWFPSPPYSAIVSMGEWGVSISKLDKNHETQIRGILAGSNILNNRHDGYGRRRQIASFDDASSSNALYDMRSLVQSAPWVGKAISNGNLVYYYLR